MSLFNSTVVEAAKKMKSVKKMFSINRTLNEARGINLSQILTICLLTSVFALPMEANAQSSTCALNEIGLTYTFASPNNWDTGSATLKTTGLPITLGAGASSVNVNGTATLINSVAGFPTTGPSGGFAASYNYQVNRTTTTVTNTVTITFSKPISKLQLVATDLDYGVDANGAYQDQVTILGNGLSGVVTPTAVATDATRVGIVGNVATSLSTSNGGNCPSALGAEGASLCNATFSFPQPITSFTYTYGNGPGAFNNPPEQLVGLAALVFCVQNPDLALACPSDSLAGAVANAGCGFEATTITTEASVVIAKTDSKTVATSGGTNNYVVTLTNQGPSVANGVIVTDVVGAGLTCPGANVVTCSGQVNGAVCPAASTIATVTSPGGITVATLPVTGSLQFAYTCNVN